MRKGRWYPTQAMLADGRIAILAGWDESGDARPTTRTSRSSPRPPSAAGRGTMTRYATGERPGTSYYPHLFTMPDGRLLLGGAEPGESALLDPARLATTGPSAVGGSARPLGAVPLFRERRAAPRRAGRLVAGRRSSAG